MAGQLPRAERKRYNCLFVNEYKPVMIVFDMLKIRCIIASLARLGNKVCGEIAELWSQLSIEPAPRANLIRHSWCGDFFSAGQSRGIARNASWLNYGHGSNSPGRIVAWPEVGVPGRWPPAVATASPAVFARVAECRS